ncbi:glucosamine-6-phosphate deaminase [Natranaerobius thermophilus]|uniref:Glucosamine-6-phosphate deaminase n=1 Tax=Natranaerobius thermophilus (strain ATCC BAA-1301 / DSM 18059 / JW/NM-WN-LF) TaxID=457570 RepID=B2A2V4_NATTJ|nr:glucosamine-6-phosphate deaminase [Natranaerobius thermophilus]ACB86322.1 glucosamine-6-phosphate isomerase [Natranaerobius thermophilus JW/NM-WN-LF]
MKLTVVDNYFQLSQKAAEIITDQIISKPNTILGLPTGRTPLGMYESLISRYQQGQLTFKDVTTFNIDEFLGISEDNPISYHSYMNYYFFDHIDIDKENTFLPPSNPEDPIIAAANYEQKVKENPVDLMILGLGTNGHIGFNEPGNSLREDTHVTELSDQTIINNKKLLKKTLGNESKDDYAIPDKAITMGIGTILSAQKLLIIANGSEKAPVIKQLFSPEITTRLPASLVKLHSNVTIIVDGEAYN